MAKLSIVKGATSVLVRIFVQDSTSTTGAGKTGLTAASFTGTKVYVARDDDGNANGTAVSLTDATRGTWSSGGIKEKDATNMPGVYEFGLTNASLATGSRSCTYLFIGTGIAPLAVEIALTGVDNADGVRGGMTALPNAAAGANAGLPLGDANARVDVGKWLGTAVSTPTVAGVPNVNTKTWNDLTTVALPLVPATPGRTLVVDAAGLADANTVKVGPTGSGTAQTAGDIPARLPAALTANGNIKASLMEILTTALTETAGLLAGGFKKFFNIATPAATMDHGVLVDTVTTLTNAPSDSSGVTTLLSRLSALRAGYLDNLSAGAVALEASLQGLITTVGVAGVGLTAADDAVLAAIAALNNLSQANVRTALGLASANLDTQFVAIASYIDTEVAAIKAKTDNLPGDPADASDIASAFSAIAATLATIASYIDTEVAAIKLKTDLIPAAPSAVGDIPTAAQNADKVLGRNLAGGSDGGRTVQDALRASRNRLAIAAGVMTVYEENDVTPAWTATVTQTAGNPVSEVDPT